MKLSRLIEFLTMYLEIYGDGELPAIELGTLILTMVNQVIDFKK